MAGFRQMILQEIKRLRRDRKAALKTRADVSKKLRTHMVRVGPELALRAEADVNRRVDAFVALCDEKLELLLRLDDSYSRSYPKLSFVQRHPVVTPLAHVEGPNQPATATAVAALAPMSLDTHRGGADQKANADLTDAEWAAVQPLLMGSRGRNDRRILGGIVWKHRSRLGWRDIPGVVGNGWTTYYNRFRGWEKSGLWAEIARALEGVPGSMTTPHDAPGDFHRRDGPTAHPGPVPWRNPGAASKLTRADVEATELPTMVNGHRLRPNSAKADIIRAAIAVLRKEGWAPRWEIQRHLQRLGALSWVNSSSQRLSVLLSESKDLFAHSRLENLGETGWYLRETEKERS
jgi:hypothetical protein